MRVMHKTTCTLIREALACPNQDAPSYEEKVLDFLGPWYAGGGTGPWARYAVEIIINL
jgi:hypothetical protein